jgi:protein MAK16
MVLINKRSEKCEIKREVKALLAAKLENAIEKEQLNRLQAGTYRDIYNLKQEDFNKALDEEEIVQKEYLVDVSEEDAASLMGGDLEDGESEIGEEEIAELEAE